MDQIVGNGLEAVVNTVLQRTAGAGVYGHTAAFEQVIDGLTLLISRHREADTEVLRFPPVMSRAQLEKSGYLQSFPHLLGCVSCLHGKEAEIRALVGERSDAHEWVDGLGATDLVLTPAACYPIYPLAAARGAVASQGLTFDVASFCFRREATHEIGRFQSFRMREYVRIGTPEQVSGFRSRWIARAEELAGQLALPYRIENAADPFFGRTGKLMAVNQIEQSLKFELLIPIMSEDNPTACMSFNYHRDHFGTTWGLRHAGGETAHTGCVAFGMDRLALALFATHGAELRDWPASVRKALAF